MLTNAVTSLLLFSLVAGCITSSPLAGEHQAISLGPLSSTSSPSYWGFETNYLGLDTLLVVSRESNFGEGAKNILITIVDPDGEFTGYAEYFVQGNQIRGRFDHRFHENGTNEIYAQVEYTGDCFVLIGIPLLLRDQTRVCVEEYQSSGLDTESKTINKWGIATHHFMMNGSTSKDQLQKFLKSTNNDGRVMAQDGIMELASSDCWLNAINAGPKYRVTLKVSSCDSNLDSFGDSVQKLIKMAPETSPQIFNDPEFKVGCYLDTLQAGVAGLQVEPLEFRCSEHLLSAFPSAHFVRQIFGNVYSDPANPLPDTTLELRLVLGDGRSIIGTPGNMAFDSIRYEDLEGMRLEVEGASAFARYNVLFNFEFRNLD